jgi:hypothetical protein
MSQDPNIVIMLDGFFAVLGILAKIHACVYLCLHGSTLTVVRLPGASEMRLWASENDSVICSIPEEQND